jgi:glycosyltransferase involved in cell wall biosynthesis
MVTPIARLLGLRIVVTHHGFDYQREKWGVLARQVLKTSEWLGMRFAHRRIAVSKIVADRMRYKYGCDIVEIPNGVFFTEKITTSASLAQFGLQAGRYVLQVSRLVPEKKQIDLIQAFAMAKLPDWKLVIVGALEPQDNYIKSVLSMASMTSKVVLTGFQSGLVLKELYTNAGCFVLPSSHEGLPIALLEALSYGLSVIASNIPAHLEIGLPTDYYFPLGDLDELASKLRKFATSGTDEKTCLSLRELVKKRYDWISIARKTLSVYTDICQN